MPKSRRNVTDGITVDSSKLELRQLFRHGIEVSPLLRHGRFRPPGYPGGHELILLAIAGEVATAEHGHRVIDSENVVRLYIDRLGDVVGEAATPVLGDGIAAGAPENVSVENSLVNWIPSNLDARAAGIEERVTGDDHGFSRGPTFPII